jgi:competence ComEA-like helix-hairpin-helix protein
MKWKQFVLDYLTFSRSEQNGVAVLLFILSVLIIANVWFPYDPDYRETGYEEFEQAVIRFEKQVQEARAKEASRFRKSWEKYSGGLFAGGDTANAYGKKQEPAFTINLNTADTLELQRLRGIGPGYARRIVQYRDRLGGFVRKSQLLEVWGMDTARYNRILSYLVLGKDTIRKIDINAIAFKDLMRHPYFPYDITREIILYRKKVKRFKKPEELLLVKGVSDSVYRRIQPYIRVE